MPCVALQNSRKKLMFWKDNNIISEQVQFYNLDEII